MELLLDEERSASEDHEVNTIEERVGLIRSRVATATLFNRTCINKVERIETRGAKKATRDIAASRLTTRTVGHTELDSSLRRTLPYIIRLHRHAMPDTASKLQ